MREPADELLEQINELYHDEQFEEALILCDQLLAKTTDPVIRAHTLRRIGDCKHQQKRYSEALEFFQKALRIKTGDNFTTCMIYLSQALTYQEMHEYNKAQIAFQCALDLATDSEDLEHIKEFWEEMLFDMEKDLTDQELAGQKKSISRSLKQTFHQLSQAKAISSKKPTEEIDWSNKPVLRA